MALPQKAIEQLSREPVRTPGWSGRILMFSGTVFFLSLAIYFGVFFGYRPYLNSQVTGLKDEIQKFSQRIPVADQERLINFYSQLVNLKSILAKQELSSKVFAWMEANTHMNVHFVSFALDLSKHKINLAGRAKTIPDLAQQLASLQILMEIKKLEFSGASLSKDGFWEFSLNLEFAPGFFGIQSNS